MAQSISKEVVEKAVKQLVAQGEKVTVRSVRGLIGQGSFSTISELLKFIDVTPTLSMSDRKDAIFDQFRMKLFDVSYEEARQAVVQELAEDRKKLEFDRVAFESVERTRVQDAERARKSAEKRVTKLEEKITEIRSKHADELLGTQLENRELKTKVSAANDTILDLTKRLEAITDSYDDIVRVLAKRTPE